MMFRYGTIWLVFVLMLMSQGAFAGSEDDDKDLPECRAILLSDEALSRLLAKDKAKRPSGIVPDYLKVQYLRRAGQVSAGAGYRIRNFYEPTLLVGYMYKPMKWKNGKAPVLTLKNSFTLLGQGVSEQIAVKGGLSVNYLLEESITSNGAVYQRALYYYQDQLYAMPFISGEWYFSRERRKSSLFMEISTVDSAIREAVNSEFVQFDEIWAVSFGMTFYLH
ncbi:hypothetical protein ACT29H_15435 [Thermophagus sp. OGC60D27]|uniref:hypothetical protein n=1 Tax=Thermophagus sp. OGC60D27 TaxID=3458415 RepID=UPI0040376144